MRDTTDFPLRWESNIIDDRFNNLYKGIDKEYLQKRNSILSIYRQVPGID